MSLPRRSGTSWLSGVLPNASTFATFLNSASSRRVLRTATVRSLRIAAVWSAASGTPETWRPNAVQVIQTVPAISAPRDALALCAASRLARRTVASETRTISSRTKRIRPTVMPVVAAPPKVSLR